MLDGRFTDREVVFVIGHELGHVARNHILKGTAWYALFAFPGCVRYGTRRAIAIDAPAALAEFSARSAP